jgi:diguanylate cyclase (GGDEF)-like protein
MGHLQMLRIGIAAVVLLAATFAPELIGSSLGELAGVSLIYAALSGAAEGLRRAGGRRQLGALSSMLLVDGVYLAWVLHLTGGLDSPLRFLPGVHVVGVSLLASYRSGLKVAMWHSLLLIVAYELGSLGVLAGGPGDGAVAAFNLTALWILAIVTALFSGINERELRRRRRDLEALAGMATDLEGVGSPKEVAEVVLGTVSEALGFRRGVLVTLREGVLEVVSGVGGAEPHEPATDPDAVLLEAWENRKPVLIRALDGDRDPFLSRLLPEASNVSVFPMISDGEPVGALVLERGGLPRIERRLVATTEQFVAHGTLAMRNAWLLETVKFLAERDPLTGVCNRRTFERELTRYLSHSERTGEPLSLALFDLDHFKKINDRHGHQAGDEALRTAARTLEEASRAFDTVARYGGEEFAVIMPALASAEALATVERLRRAIGAEEGSVPLSASAGVATYPNNARDAESLIRNADEALYQAKAAGRARAKRSRRRGGFRQVEEAG